MPTQNFKVGEMLNKRTENSKTWMNFDGSYTTEIHSGIVHYADEHGNLQNINTDLFDEADFDSIDFPVAKDGDSLFHTFKEKSRLEKRMNKLDRENFDYQGLKVPFECKIPRNIRRGYTIGKGASKLTFVPVGASVSKGYVEGNKITYQDVWNDADLILEVLPNGIKETIILKSEKAPVNFSFQMKGEESAELKIEPPWLQDANGTKRDVAQTIADGKLTLSADVNGLVYPIEIDPTVTIQPDATAGKDAMISSQDPDTNFGTLTVIEVANTTYQRRSLLEFDLSAVPFDAQIQSADLILFFQGATESGFKDLVVKPVTSAWTETGVTWNTRPSVSASVSDTTNTALNIASVSKTLVATKSIQHCISNPNYGLELSIASTTSSQKEFTSSDGATASNRPKLTITYNQPPTAPTVTAPNGGETWNSSHTVTWNPSTDPESTPTKGLDYQNGTTLIGTGTQRVAQRYKPTNDIYVTQVLAGISFDVATADYVPLNVKRVSDGSVIATGGGEVSGNGYNRHSFPLNTPALLLKGQEYEFEFLIPAFGIGLRAYGTTTGGPYDTAQYLDNVSSVYNRMNLHFYYTDGAPQSYLKYQIQLSTDNGGAWKDIVSLTPSGATSADYDFINELETSLAKVRIRAYDGYIYGPWDESDGVFTIQHNQAPTTPTNLAPSNISVDRAAAIRASWQHNDPNNNDPQSKFDLQWRPQGSATWNDISQITVNQYYDFPANTFLKGVIEWRVRTYDQENLSSPYSPIVTFFAGDKPPPPTITAPGSTVSVANPVVQWSSSEQTGFVLTVKDSAGTTVFTESRNNNTKAATVTYNLANGASYTIELKVKNTESIFSDPAILPITVSYTPPAIPDIATVKGDSYIQINIADPAPTGTQPTVLYHEIYKEIDGGFVRVATNVQSEYKDYHVASGEATRYFVRTHGDNETFADTITFTESIAFIGVWLHVVDEAESTVNQFKFDGDGRSSKWALESAVHRFQGRRNPVIETGEMQDFNVDFSLKILNDTERTALENIVYSQQTVCYRDGRGRKAFGVFVDVPLSDETWRGYSTSLTLMKIDFSEGV